MALLAMGGPREETEVAPFLEALFSDRRMIRLPWFLRPFQDRLARRIARRRTPLVAPKYAAIGHSPLVATTEALARALEDTAGAAGRRLSAWAGMRYGPPRTPDVLGNALPTARATRVVLLPQYPFYSGATTESSLLEAEAAVTAHGLRPLRIERFGDHPLHLQLVEEQVRAVWDDVPMSRRDEAHLLFSAHGLPESYVRRGDPYHDEVRRAFEAVRDRLADIVPKERFHLSFQSRVGPVEWLRPYTDETLVRLGRSGVRSLVVVPFGFTCEHLETLEEIDIQYRELAHDNGITGFHRVPTPGTDPRYVALQLDLVEQALADDDGGAR
ncbi:MAG: ferrochelatase [Euryarchaeota archaeon]|nr:ferrochelatase [Euryarchaeota archaeon]